MASNTSRRSDDHARPHQQPYQGPFAGLADDSTSHGDQGEVVVLPFQFVVAPDYGRFHPASLPPPTNGTLMLAAGTLIGEVRNGTLRQQIHSPFTGPLDTWLVNAGQIVIPGQPVCSLHTTQPTTTATVATVHVEAAGGS